MTWEECTERARVLLESHHVPKLLDSNAYRVFLEALTEELFEAYSAGYENGAENSSGAVGEPQ